MNEKSLRVAESSTWAGSAVSPVCNARRFFHLTGVTLTIYSGECQP